LTRSVRCTAQCRFVGLLALVVVLVSKLTAHGMAQNENEIQRVKCIREDAMKSSPKGLILSSWLPRKEAEALADSWKVCRHFYLDIGTNVGVQIQKLYHPASFPNSRVMPVFDEYFGRNGTIRRQQVCAFGIEPNPVHLDYLTELNAYWRKNGFLAVVFTGWAAGSHGGNVTFFSDTDRHHAHQGAASTSHWMTGPTQNWTVQFLDLPKFINTIITPLVAEQEKEGGEPKVVMKMDIEGAEYSLFPSMIVRGALCNLDLIFDEWHPTMQKTLPEYVHMTQAAMVDAFKEMRRTSPTCKVKLLNLDDETWNRAKMNFSKPYE